MTCRLAIDNTVTNGSHRCSFCGVDRKERPAATKDVGNPFAASICKPCALRCLAIINGDQPKSVGNEVRLRDALRSAIARIEDIVAVLRAHPQFQAAGILAETADGCRSVLDGDRPHGGAA